jgi:hypothetical protein
MGATAVYRQREDMADWSRDEETVGELISRARLMLG